MTMADELTLILRIHARVLELKRLAAVTARIHARLQRRLCTVPGVPAESRPQPRVQQRR